MWWFGQNGYIFKSPEGTLAGVDLYLTNSCEGLAPGMDLSRRVPVLVEPEDIDIDVFACTHNHQDQQQGVHHQRTRQTFAFESVHRRLDGSVAREIRVMLLRSRTSITG